MIFNSTKDTKHNESTMLTYYNYTSNNKYSEVYNKKTLIFNDSKNNERYMLLNLSNNSINSKNKKKTPKR
jgi:hypothetical protein